MDNTKQPLKTFVSWSGGKETSLACYRAMQDKNLEVKYLLNMVSEDGRHSRSHGISSALLKAQSDTMGIPIIQRKTTWKGYEGVFKEAVSGLKEEGIKVGVFGDIDLQEHRDWVERVCREIGIKPLLPLWKEGREGLLKEFIRAGFKAIVIATRADLLGREWLGRKIDEEFIRDLKRLGSIDLCGEKGEYHTFVYDGPIFKELVRFSIGKKIFKNKHWFLQLAVKK
ncbi:diphthine--ammonia ligase [bacterium]|nr:diphthine--ammonia ligase [bacterium]MBU4560994.1 diphthine--ammonia ligase [bacterium]MCG2677195.1 diphthine--ammonia ligase [bacterium]